jgi:succinoglycan biosynthesis protein ExoM
LLTRLLSKLELQETEGLFEYSVVVVDNDRAESGRRVSESFAPQTRMNVSYFVESEQNIALARNRAVQEAKGDFLAFIDDDEFPCNRWLLNLYQSLRKFNADGVLGPVIPFFEIEPPRWVVRGRFFERQSFETGTVIRNAKHTRTGNVLFSGDVFTEKASSFDPLFGITGGEDVDFFRRMMQKGKVFTWCNEAFVNESVPRQRLKRSYLLRRALLRGVANAERASFLSFSMLKSVTACVLYSASLPLLFLLLWRHEVFMKYLIRNCDHLGKVLALCRLKVVVARDT